MASSPIDRLYQKLVQARGSLFSFVDQPMIQGMANALIGRSGDTFNGTVSIAPTQLVDQPVVYMDGSLGNYFTLTLTANRTLSVSNLVPGTTYRLLITQDAVGGRTMTWPFSFSWSDTTNGALSTAPNATDLLTVVTLDGTTLLASISKGYTRALPPPPTPPTTSWRQSILAAYDSVEGGGGGATTNALAANAAPNLVSLSLTGATSRTFAFRIAQNANANYAARQCAMLYFIQTGTGLNTTTPYSVRTATTNTNTYASVTGWQARAWSPNEATFSDSSSGNALWNGRGQTLYIDNSASAVWVEVTFTNTTGTTSVAVGVYDTTNPLADFWFVAGMSITIQTLANATTCRSLIQAEYASADPVVLIGARGGAADMVTYQTGPAVAYNPALRYIWCDLGPNWHLQPGALPRASGSTAAQAIANFRGSFDAVVNAANGRYVYFPSLTFNNAASTYNSTGNPPVRYDTTPSNGLLPVNDFDLWTKSKAAPANVFALRSDDLFGADGYLAFLGFQTAVRGPSLASFQMNALPIANSTLVLNYTGSGQGDAAGTPVTITFVASGATGLQVNIGADVATTVTSLLALLNGATAQADPNLSQFYYTAGVGSTSIFDIQQQPDGTNKGSPQYAWTASTSPASNIAAVDGVANTAGSDGVHPPTVAPQYYRRYSFLPAVRHAYSGGNWGPNAVEDWCSYFEPATGLNGGMPAAVKAGLTYAMTQQPSQISASRYASLVARLAAVPTTWTPSAGGPLDYNPTWYFSMLDGGNIDLGRLSNPIAWRDKMKPARIMRQRSGYYTRIPIYGPRRIGTSSRYVPAVTVNYAPAFWSTAGDGFATLFDNLADFTIGFWWSPSQTFAVPIIEVTNGATINLSVGQAASGIYRAGVYLNASALALTDSGGTVNQMTFFCVTRSGSTVTIYRDGVVTGTATYATAVAAGNTNVYFLGGSTNPGFGGTLHEVFGIHGTALTVAQIAALRTYGQALFGAP